MRSKFPPILWLLVAALIVQGTLPGLVICFGEAGHVELERMRDGCCDEPTRTAVQTAVVIFTESNTSSDQDSCGPCTDSAILPGPVTKPSEIGVADDYATTCAILVFIPVIDTPLDYLTEPYSSADAAFIPISTTTLLI